MNTRQENEEPAPSRETRTAAPGPEGFEPEPPPPSDTSDFREMVEGGYGWGV